MIGEPDHAQNKNNDGDTITHTEAQNKDLFVAGKFLCSLNKNITIKRSYLPCDVINERHVIQVFTHLQYKPTLINKEIQSMKELKRSFKQCACDVIEKCCINAANKLGWCNNYKQAII